MFIILGSQVVSSQLDTLTEQQKSAVSGLRQSSQQAEDALSQGLERLQETLSETLTCDPSGTPGVTNYMEQMANAMGKLEALVSFVTQDGCLIASMVMNMHLPHKADLLRQQALRQMYSILTTHQAARGLLALGDYFQRLRALSSLWAARPHEPT
ncbi:hypothetical protein MUK42_13421 [Musa troglodytarum]|uniref:DOG1 domain-containing protein n=1 Tax=Musa troglodytarum TaxID=320322 RepID=A0A9E7GNB6_9LILI|nr:hypothetical protein MUK42_13421 [Musa troglodytarum]